MEWYEHLIFIVLILYCSVVFYLAWFRNWGERWVAEWHQFVRELSPFPISYRLKRWFVNDHKIGVTFTLFIKIITTFLL